MEEEQDVAEDGSCGQYIERERPPVPVSYEYIENPKSKSSSASYIGCEQKGMEDLV